MLSNNLLHACANHNQDKTLIYLVMFDHLRSVSLWGLILSLTLAVFEVCVQVDVKFSTTASASVLEMLMSGVVNPLGLY